MSEDKDAGKGKRPSAVSAKSETPDLNYGSATGGDGGSREGGDDKGTRPSPPSEKGNPPPTPKSKKE